MYWFKSMGGKSEQEMRASERGRKREGERARVRHICVWFTAGLALMYLNGDRSPVRFGKDGPAPRQELSPPPHMHVHEPVREHENESAGACCGATILNFLLIIIAAVVSECDGNRNPDCVCILMRMRA
jgi:hypothetical protein